MFVVTTIVCYIIIIIIIGEIDYRKNYPRKYVNNIVTWWCDSSDEKYNIDASTPHTVITQKQ